MLKQSERHSPVMEMKLGFSLEQELSQQLNLAQIQSLQLLQMSSLELDAFLDEAFQENPLIEVQDPYVTIETNTGNELSEYLNRQRWMDEHDRQNSQISSDSDFESYINPIDLIGSDGGLEMALDQFLYDQIDRLNLLPDLKHIVRSLIPFLDSSGYLTETDDELLGLLQTDSNLLHDALDILRSLEPAGTGARNLSDCLILQLDRIPGSTLAVQIAQNYLIPLSQKKYMRIAKELDVSVPEVIQSEAQIKNCNPRPGRTYQKAERAQYIIPDLKIALDGDSLSVSLLREKDSRFSFNQYYMDLLRNSPDEEVREYLSEQFQKARSLQHALEQRGVTMLRCAESIAKHQKEFFLRGEEYLLPMKMNDIAAELNLHPSTISRAVRLKYIQCCHGVFPMSYFFSNTISGKATGENASMKLENILKRMIMEEDPFHPLSDQRLATLISESGCPVSRRTVTKYREKLNIPSTSGRQQNAYAKEIVQRNRIAGNHVK